MARINKSIEIEASPERVFSLLADPEQQPQWSIFLKGLEPISGDGRSAGSTQRWQFKVGPRVQPLEVEVVVYNENQALVRRGKGALQMEDRIFLAPFGEGTRVEWSIEYEPPMGAMGRLVDALFMNRVFQNDVEQSLENLKEQAEV